MTTATISYQIDCPRAFNGVACGGQLKRDPDSGELGCLLCSRVCEVVNGIVRRALVPDTARTSGGVKPRVH
jgi:hypothetical protein